MAIEAIKKLSPHRTLYLRGFDRRGAAVSLNNASASDFTVSGCWSDQADFAVLVLHDADDIFGHLFTTRYLPSASLAGVTLDFDLAVSGAMNPISPKYQSVPWGSLSYITAAEQASGAGPLANVLLADLATAATGGNAASLSYTIPTPSSGQYIQVVFGGNSQFAATAGATDTAATLAATLASAINTCNWAAYNPSIAMMAVASGATLTIYAARWGTVNVTGTTATWEGGTNFIGMNAGDPFYVAGTLTAVGSVASASSATLAASASATGAAYLAAGGGRDGNLICLEVFSDIGGAVTGPVKLTGGNDPASVHYHIDFTAQGIDNCRQIWFTFAPTLNSDSSAGNCHALAAYQPAEWSAVFSDWTTADPGTNLPLKIAGPGSVTVGSRDSWCTYTGAGWQDQPNASGVSALAGSYYRGFSRISANPGDSVTIAYSCQFTHDLYLGTAAFTSTGMWHATVDGVAQPDVDSYANTGSVLSVRRPVKAGIAAGTHTVVLTVSESKNAASSGTNCVLDFVQAAVKSDVQDPSTMYSAVGVAMDFDTDQTYKLAPKRALWIIRQAGLTGDIDFYAGVFFAFKRVRNGGSFHAATVTFSGTFSAGDGVFLQLGGDAYGDGVGTVFGVGVTAYDTTTSIAERFANQINQTFVGVRASAGAGVLTITQLSPINGFTLFSSAATSTGTSGTVTVYPYSTPMSTTDGVSWAAIPNSTNFGAGLTERGQYLWWQGNSAYSHWVQVGGNTYSCTENGYSTAQITTNIVNAINASDPNCTAVVGSVSNIVELTLKAGVSGPVTISSSDGSASATLIADVVQTVGIGGGTYSASEATFLAAAGGDATLALGNLIANLASQINGSDPNCTAAASSYNLTLTLRGGVTGPVTVSFDGGAGIVLGGSPAGFVHQVTLGTATYSSAQGAQTAAQIAAGIAAQIAAGDVNCTASAMGATITISLRGGATGPVTISGTAVDAVGATATLSSGGAANTVSGDVLTGNEGTWAVDATQAAPLNRAFIDYFTDLCGLAKAAGMTLTCAFSQELLQPPDVNTAAGAWTQRFADGTPVMTSTGFGSWGAGLVEAVSGSGPATVKQTGHGYITNNLLHAASATGSGVWRVTVTDADHYQLTAPVSNSGGYTPGVGDAVFVELQTSQGGFSSVTVTPYAAGCFKQAAGVMSGAGLTPWLQFGEILHWFFSKNMTMAVSSVANTTPVSVTTAGAHGLATGQTVILAGCRGSLSINGRQAVTVTGPATFTIDGSSGGGTWTGGGTVSGGGMAFYDANQTAAATAALGRPLASFWTQDDDPASADANFLATRLKTHVDTIRTTVLATYGSAKFELLWPYDVCYASCYFTDDMPWPQGGRLNRAINLPSAWSAKAGSGLDRMKMEGLSWSATYHNADKAKETVRFPYTVLSWAKADTAYLIPWFNAGCHWTKEYLFCKNEGTPMVNFWALDHGPLLSWPVNPLPSPKKRITSR